MSDRWQRIEQLYHAAVERKEGSQRAAFLREACAGDEALRHEVESLLAREASADELLEAPALEVVAKEMGEESGDRGLIGRTIGCYQVVSLLGAGGMGEVYQAHDTKLRRNVAVKVLPSTFTDDPERLARFQREARMLASLNHPNIATIHGLEQSDGVHYLVIELVAGQTLAERLKSGALDMDEALKIGAQIAEALEAAHEKGVIHRDLKPANIKVTPEGRVKVLDFGLAKTFAGEGGQELSNAPTLTAMGTEEGRVMGTPAYMSPEQARGKPVDKRTDIWAFGCVLYELLTGKHAFRGETLSDTIAAVLEKEPDWQVLPPAIPSEIREVLRRCLQKSPRSRLHDIADVRIEIEEALSAHTKTESAASAKGTRAPWQETLFWCVALLILAALVGVAIRSLKPSPSTVSGPVSRIAITLPPGQALAGMAAGPALAISPDGTHIAYIASEGGAQQLYLRALEGLETRRIPGSDGAIEPFFSPDGQWVGFFAGGKLVKASVNTGQTVSVGDAPDGRGASWGSHGTIAFAPTRASVLAQVPDGGGTAQPLTRLEKVETSHRWPEFLPGDAEVLFAALNAGANWNDARIAAQSVRTGARRDLIQTGTHPSYAPSGHLVYAQGGTLFAVPFDLHRLEVGAPAVPVAQGVLQSQLSGAAQYSLSSTGTLVYVPFSAQANQRRMAWVSRSGVEQALAAPARAYRQPRLAPDGRRIAVSIEEQETQIWLYDLARDTLTRMTLQGAMNRDSIWTPDGKRITYVSSFDPKKGFVGLFWQQADGSGVPEQLNESHPTPSSWPSSWSPDGQLLALGGTGKGRIYVFRLSDRQIQPFHQMPFSEGGPSFSPDGRWLAYTSDESGRYEIYVQPYPGPGGKWQISTEGGTEPLWNRSGRELFYRSGNKMMAVDIIAQPNFSAGKPKTLFEGPYQPSPVLTANYDVSPDGQHFLVLRPGASEVAPTQINVVLNWFEELKRRVPTKQ